MATTVTGYSGADTWVVGPDGSGTVSTTDVLGRLTSQSQCTAVDAESGACTDPITTGYGYVTLSSASETYEGVGFQKVTVTDAEANETVFVSNLAGQRTYMLDPNAGFSEYTYTSDGLTDTVTSEAGTVDMDYDVLGRMISRTSEDLSEDTSSSASWTYNTTSHLGSLDSSSSTTVIGTDSFTTSTAVSYDSLHRPTSTTVTLPTDDALGDLSGYAYETSVEYNDDVDPENRVYETGVVSGSTLPAVGGLPNEVISTGYRLNGMAQTLTLAAPGETPAWSTDLVTGTVVDGTGLFLSRSYGNGVVREVGWDDVTRTPSVIQASFEYGDPVSTKFLQQDVLTRDVTGRVVRIEDEKDPAVSSAQCFVYDGYNRLAKAWTTDGTCGSMPVVSDGSWLVGAPESVPYQQSYATEWSYSDSGRIASILNLAADGSGMRDVYQYPTQGVDPVPHGVTDVGAADVAGAVDEFTSGTYTAGTGEWDGSWVETGDDADPASGLISTSDSVLKLHGAPGAGTEAVLARTVDTAGMATGSLTLGLAAFGQALESGDQVTVTLIPDEEPLNAVTEVVTGDGLTVVTDPDWETGATVVEISLDDVLPATSVEIQVGVTQGVDDGEGETLEGVAVTDVTLVMESTVADPDSEAGYTYDDAGRIVSRTVDGTTTTLEWDVSSNLVKTVDDTTTILYVYNESGQRVAKIDTSHDTATAYLGSTEVTDPNMSSSSTGDLVGTRFYTFGGATVAVRDGSTGSLTDSLSLLLGDYQGSASVMMPVTVNTGGDMAAATVDDATNATYNTYLPYGATRGTDNLAINHGWLNQVVDNGANDTGLVYLNARYYDPAASRFISPDPLMDPMDPKTLDPYRYADNNPVVLQDTSGLNTGCTGLTGHNQMICYYQYAASSLRQDFRLLHGQPPLFFPGANPMESMREKIRWGIEHNDPRIAYNQRQARKEQANRDRTPQQAIGDFLKPEAIEETDPTVYRDDSTIVKILKNYEVYATQLPNDVFWRQGHGGLEVGDEWWIRYNHFLGASNWEKFRRMADDGKALQYNEQGLYWNCAISYLGSHNALISVADISDDGTVTVDVRVTNSTTAASASPFYAPWRTTSRDEGFNNFAQNVSGWAGIGDPESQLLVFTMRIDSHGRVVNNGASGG